MIHQRTPLNPGKHFHFVFPFAYKYQENVDISTAYLRTHKMYLNLALNVIKLTGSSMNQFEATRIITCYECLNTFQKHSFNTGLYQINNSHLTEIVVINMMNIFGYLHLFCSTYFRGNDRQETRVHVIRCALCQFLFTLGNNSRKSDSSCESFEPDFTLIQGVPRNVCQTLGC